MVLLPLTKVDYWVSMVWNSVVVMVAWMDSAMVVLSGWLGQN